MPQRNIILKPVTLLRLAPCKLCATVDCIDSIGIWCHVVAQLEGKIEESVAIKEELQKQYASLEENLKKVEAEKTVGALCIWLIPLQPFVTQQSVIEKNCSSAGFDSVLWR
jgi:hypothetical protein